jgi:hypothetical protein
MSIANRLLNPWLIFCVWLLLWVGRLWLIPRYFERTLELGYYPPEADSITIPIMANGMLTVVLGPVYAIVLWLLLRRSPIERRSWLGWNHNRPIISLAWTILFGALAALIVQQLVEDIRIGLYWNALADVGWLALWLAVRAMVVSRIRDRNPQNDYVGAVPSAP